MGRKKLNYALNKENKKKLISISPKKVNGVCVLEKNNSVIRPALESNSKKIKKVSFQMLNANNIMSVQKAYSSVPAANKLNTTDKKRKISVALEKSDDILDKMVANNPVDTNCNNLPSVNGRKRKGAPNTDLVYPKKEKGMVLDKDQSLQPAKIKKKGVINQMKHLKVVLVNLETPTKAKKIKEDLQKTSKSSTEENGKVGKKYALRISPKSTKVKYNKSKSPPPKVLRNRKSNEENGIAGKIKDAEMSPEPKNFKKEKGVEPKSAKKNIKAGKIKDNGTSLELKKPKKEKVGLKSKNANSIERKVIAGEIKDNGISPELKNPKKEKDGLKPNAKSIEKNGIAGLEMSPETKKANINKILPSKNTESIEKNGIAVQINKSRNLKKSNKECLTIDQIKETINLQRTRLNEMRKIKCLNAKKIKRIENKSVAGLAKVKDLVKLEKLKDSISDFKRERKNLDDLQNQLCKMIKKANRVCTTGPSEPVGDTYKPKKEKVGLEPNTKSIEINGIAGLKMSPETKKANDNKILPLKNTDIIKKNVIDVQMNDSVNFQRNKECFTIDQIKDSINLQKSRLDEIRKIKCLNAKKIKLIENKSIAGSVKDKDLVNLEKLKDSISIWNSEKRILVNLKRRLSKMIKKANQVCTTGPPEAVKNTLNTYIKKKLAFSGTTIIDVNESLGLLANISVWSELLANLPKEDRVMIFEPPSLLVPFLTEGEPLVPLRQVIKDLGLILQKEQEMQELKLLTLQTPIEDNGLSLPPTDDSEAKVDAAPVTLVELEETDESENEEEIPQKKKGKGENVLSCFSFGGPSPRARLVQPRPDS